MGTSVLSQPPGVAYPVKRTPLWDTTVQTNVSGKEVRIANQIYPRYKWDFDINVLRSSSTYSSTEFQYILGFFNTLQGQFDTFLYQDADDNSVTGQSIGTGDGSTLTFQLVRTLGGFVEPILAPRTVSKVYVDGVDQAGNWTVSNWGTASPGVITFSGGHAPANGKAVTADFTYYWPVRMVSDSQDFSLDFRQIYSTQKFSFISVKN